MDFSAGALSRLLDRTLAYAAMGTIDYVRLVPVARFEQYDR